LCDGYGKIIPTQQGLLNVEFVLHVQHAPKLIFKCSMADDYDTCIDERARAGQLCQTSYGGLGEIA
jgi:hypothetical protein